MALTSTHSLFLNIHRPPKYSATLFDNLSKILSITCIEFHCIVIVGDNRQDRGQYNYMVSLITMSVYIYTISDSAMGRIPPQQGAHSWPNYHQMSKYFQGCVTGVALISMFSSRVQSSWTQKSRIWLWKSITLLNAPVA